MASKQEQETIIRRDADGLHAWSNIPGDIARMKRQGWTLVRQDQYGAAFTAPDRAITIQRAEKRVMSAQEIEQRQASALRARMHRGSKRIDAQQEKESIAMPGK